MMWVFKESLNVEETVMSDPVRKKAIRDFKAHNKNTNKTLDVGQTERARLATMALCTSSSNRAKQMTINLRRRNAQELVASEPPVKYKQTRLDERTYSQPVRSWRFGLVRRPDVAG